MKSGRLRVRYVAEADVPNEEVCIGKSREMRRRERRKATRTLRADEKEEEKEI